MKIEFKIGINHPDKKEWHDYWIKITIRRIEYDEWIFVSKKWLGFDSVCLYGYTRKYFGFIKIMSVHNDYRTLACTKKDTHQDAVDSMAYMVNEFCGFEQEAK